MAQLRYPTTPLTYAAPARGEKSSMRSEVRQADRRRGAEAHDARRDAGDGAGDDARARREAVPARGILDLLGSE